MSTYREVVYMCLDLLKVNSDDSYFTEDHVIYLLNKFRSLVLKKKYEKELDQNAGSRCQMYSVSLRSFSEMSCAPTESTAAEKFSFSNNTIIICHSSDSDKIKIL